MIAENGLEERGNQKVLSTLDQRKFKFYEILPPCCLLCQVVVFFFFLRNCTPKLGRLAGKERETAH